MTTRSGLRTSIRAELNDSGGTPMFADSLLNEWINEAIRTYSRELPEEASATVTVVADQASYALPARTTQVMRVEQPKDAIRVPISGSRTSASVTGELIDLQARVTRAGPWGYRVFGGNLILDPIPSAIGGDEDIRLEYVRGYAEPTADGDTIATPATDDDVLIHLACAAALRWVAGDESKRVRYQETRGIAPGPTAVSYRERAMGAIAARTQRIRTRTLEFCLRNAAGDKPPPREER